jgi:hypothetical protein
MGAPSAGVEGGRVRRRARRGARNQGFLGPSAAPPSGGECGCARRVPVSGERRAGRGPREQQASRQRSSSPAAAASRRRRRRRWPLRASPPRHRQPRGAAPRPDPPPPPPGPDLCSPLVSVGNATSLPEAGSRARGAEAQEPVPAGPADQTQQREPPPGPARLHSRPGAVPSAPPRKPESERSPAEPQIQPKCTRSSAQRLPRGAAAWWPCPGDPPSPAGGGEKERGGRAGGLSRR